MARFIKKTKKKLIRNFPILSKRRCIFCKFLNQVNKCNNKKLSDFIEMENPFAISSLNGKYLPWKPEGAYIYKIPKNIMERTDCIYFQLSKEYKDKIMGVIKWELKRPIKINFKERYNNEKN